MQGNRFVTEECILKGRQGTARITNLFLGILAVLRFSEEPELKMDLRFGLDAIIRSDLKNGCHAGNDNDAFVSALRFRKF